MKKLWQMLLVFAMAVSCVCAVACSNKNKNENKTCKHDYKETVVAATCTTGGYTEHKCSKCGDTYKDNEVAALNHDMTDWAEKTPATCTAAQVLEKHCKRTGCDYEETKDGDVALNHDMEWTITLNPTCTADGKKDGACKRTGCTYTETDVKIDKLGHHYVESKTDPKAKAATCTEDGLKVEICDNPGCDDDETRKESVIPALGHTDDGTKAVVTDPTCTEQGYTTYHCETCDQDYRDDYVNELGHEMALEQTVKVSCLTDGYKLWICQRDNCEYSEKREIADKLDHAFNDNGECTNGCGKTINDKITWVNTAYSVTYNESKDKLSINYGDPGKTLVSRDVTIPAEWFKNLPSNAASFKISMYCQNTEERPYFAITTADGTTVDAHAHVGPVTATITITDDMRTNGYIFKAAFADNRQMNGWQEGSATVCGFDLDIEYIKVFDIEDKTMWFKEEEITYSEEKDKWVVTGKNPGADVVSKSVTIKADVFKNLPSNINRFTIKMYCQDPDSRPQFGLHDGTAWRVWHHAHLAPLVYTVVGITDDMRANGYQFTAAYLDNHQNNPTEWTDETNVVYGFDLDIEFEQQITLDSATSSYTYDDNVAYDGTIFTFNVESAEGSSASGGVYFTIGSYGVYFRGEAFRPATFNGTGAAAVSHSGQGLLSVATFNKGVQIGVSVAIKDENTVTVTVYVNGTKNCEQDITRVTGEIESDAATARVEINTSEVTKLVLIV